MKLYEPLHVWDTGNAVDHAQQLFVSTVKNKDFVARNSSETKIFGKKQRRALEYDKRTAFLITYKNYVREVYRTVSTATTSSALIIFKIRKQKPPSDLILVSVVCDLWPQYCLISSRGRIICFFLLKKTAV